MAPVGSRGAGTAAGGRSVGRGSQGRVDEGVGKQVRGRGERFGNRMSPRRGQGREIIEDGKGRTKGREGAMEGGLRRRNAAIEMPVVARLRVVYNYLCQFTTQWSPKGRGGGRRRRRGREGNVGEYQQCKREGAREEKRERRRRRQQLPVLVFFARRPRIRPLPSGRPRRLLSLCPLFFSFFGPPIP